MNHETAIQTLAAESYLLGDMAPAEREEFEQHFFECQECAQDIRDAMQLMTTVEAESPKTGTQPVPAAVTARPTLPAPKKQWAWLQPRFAAGMISALAAACIVEAIFIPTLQHRLAEATAPRVATTAFLVPPVRGSLKVVKAAEGEPLILLLDLPDSASGRLQFVLKNKDGQAQARMFGDAPPAGQPVPISIPRMDLAPGEYTLVVEAPAATGQDGQELSRYPFELQRP